MKNGALVFLLLCCLCDAAPEDHGLWQTAQKRRRGLQQSTISTRRRSKRECVAFLVEKQYEDGRHVDQPLECELQGEDLDGKKYKMVRVKGLTSSWAEKSNVTSGVTTIFAPEGATIDDYASELIVPSGTAIKFGIRKKNGSAQSQTSMMNSSDLYSNRRLKTGERTVLVVRIVAKDSKTTATEAQLADDIFGASGDVFNLVSGYAQCSYGTLQLKPFTSHTLVRTDGIYTVNLPNTVVKGIADSKVLSAAEAQVAKDLGIAPNLLANHVMYCIPPGTSGNWIAWAIINGWKSVYNDAWCQSPSGQMHEFGHNLNLAHSNEGSVTYDDKSGLMGYSYGSDEGPRMCFNGAKTWQLGWFSTYHVDLPIANNFNWDGDLIGFAERDSTVSTSDRMIVRIRSTTDYYIHFNRRFGINSGTQEAGDQVLVAKRSPGTGYAFSYLSAKLSADGVYTISNFNGSKNPLSIVVRKINTSTIPARATISVRFGPSPAPVQPTNAPTRRPTTAPTSTSTSAPTRLPTSSPTRAPTGVPSNAPTTSDVPTNAPTTSLAPTTSIAPSDAPTSARTAAQTSAPTSAPTTKAPTTEAPTTRSPTTKAPTTRAPTTKPTLAPTRLPTRKPTAPFCNKNGVCEPGENCASCPNDCRGGFSGYPVTDPMCCKGGACVIPRCTENGWQCK